MRLVLREILSMSTGISRSGGVIYGATADNRFAVWVFSFSSVVLDSIIHPDIKTPAGLSAGVFAFVRRLTEEMEIYPFFSKLFREEPDQHVQYDRERHTPDDDGAGTDQQVDCLILGHGLEEVLGVLRQITEETVETDTEILPKGDEVAREAAEEVPDFHKESNELHAESNKLVADFQKQVFHVAPFPKRERTVSRYAVAVL